MRVREGVALLPYAAVAAVHVGAKLAPNRRVDSATKPLLIPLLGLGVLTGRRPPVLLIGSLFFSWIGDLTIDRSFRTGLAAFLAAHICLIALFWSGMRQRLSPWSLLAVPWLIFVLLVLTPRRIGALYPAVLTYALTLGAMAVSSTRGNRRTGLGGMLFLISDTTIALRQYTPWIRTHHWGAVVMATYLAAQALLVDGVIGARVTD
jgi:uncharacterized membrane protein YhhN